MKNTITLALAVTLLLVPGCATIISGPNQKVSFDSQPTGATIYLDDKEIGQTPSVFTLARRGRFESERPAKKSYEVRIELDGYEAYEMTIDRKLNAWLFGNILVLGGVIGVAIDASNGSMYKLSPKEIDTQFNSSSDASIKNTMDDIFIGVTLDIDPNWEKIGTLERKAD
ncbi:MAG: PEGA domain-containing protein [Cyclobacteriaceae bacterium]